MKDKSSCICTVISLYVIRCIAENIPVTPTVNENGEGTLYIDGEQWDIDVCKDNCSINKELYARLLCFAFKFSGVPSQNMCDFIKQHSGLYTDAKKIIEDVSAELEYTGKKTWFERFWAKVPGVSSILWTIGKISLFIGGICLLCRMVTSLMNLSTDIDTQKQKSLLDNESVSQDRELGTLWYESQKKEFSHKLATLGNMPASGTSATVGLPRGNPVAIKQFLPQAAEEQTDVILNMICRNTFWLVVERVDPGSSTRTSLPMRCIGICGNYFICLDHYMYYMRELTAEGVDYDVYYLTSNTKTLIDIHSIKFYTLRNSALFVGRMPPSIPAFRNIVKFFASAESGANFNPIASLVEPKYNATTGSVFPTITSFPRIKVQDNINISNDDNSFSYVDKVYVYAKSARGLCGSVLVADYNTPCPILGIHVAGKTSDITGYAEAVCRETFEHLLEGLCPSDDSVVVSNCGVETAKLIPITNVQLLGVVPSSEQARPAIASRLVHTECYNKITPSTYDFPVLHSKDVRIADAPFSPLLEGCNFHGCPPIDFPNQEMLNAFEDLNNKILANVRPVRSEVGMLPIDIAINGCVSLEGYESIDMKTSEGYPWTLDRPKLATNKSWLFDRALLPDGGWKLIKVNDKLLHVMAEKDKLRLSNSIPATVFVASLKDAKLPKEKATIVGKTRIFSISPIDFTIQQRQLFMDFTVAYQRARLDAEHAIGIDIKSLEVTHLVNRLLNNSSYLITGDYSKFGDQLMASCVYNVYQIMINWYWHYGDHSEENRTRRRVMCHEVKNAKILILNLIYQCFCGMPSGNPLTVVINSMVNSLYTRIVWQLIMKENCPKFYPLSCFNDNVVKVFYGDDLIMSVKDEVKDLYNTATMSAMFSRYGIKFTDSSKSAKIVPYARIDHDSVTFLKHSFHRHPNRHGVWIARLDLRATQEVCNWTWKTSRDLREASVEACRSMLEDAYGGGPQYYNGLRSKVISYWRDRNVSIVIPTWFEMDIRIFGV